MPLTYFEDIFCNCFVIVFFNNLMIKISNGKQLSVFCSHWHTDLSLFDELEKLGDELRDADELLEALDNAGYVSNSAS